MNYVIAVFMSRTETLSYANLLRRMGIPASIISTPKEAGRTCGLSVKFSHDFFSYGKTALTQGRFRSFQGFFLERKIGGRDTIIKG